MLIFRIPLASDSECSDRTGGEEEEDSEADVEKESQNHLDYLSGRYSPKLIQGTDLEADTIIYNPADDIRRLEYARSQVLKTGIKVRIV